MNCPTKISPEFGEEYFKSNNYANYAEREPRYWGTAKELADSLFKLGMINLATDRILDYGCAVGFLVTGFRTLGFKCDGYDISAWAKQIALSRGVRYVPFKPRNYDLIIALDVFEHMTDEGIKLALENFKSSMLVTRIPCALLPGQTFHLEVSQADKTHINCKTSEEWIRFFKINLGFRMCFPLQLFNIYDSPGVFCALWLK
jgi:hypothetical protein